MDQPGDVQITKISQQACWPGLLCLPEGRADRLRLRRSGQRPLLLPGRSEGLHRPGVYDELDRRFGAPGDFAQAYVLAHEIGHHVQNLLGIERQVREAQAQRPRAANQFSVALELQADCFAGIWANATAKKDILDPGDIDEGLNAAAAVGDDKLQRQATGRVNPDSFTHGSAKERAEWFRRGYQSGNIDSCDTFGSGNWSSPDGFRAPLARSSPPAQAPAAVSPAPQAASTAAAVPANPAWSRLAPAGQATGHCRGPASGERKQKKADAAIAAFEAGGPYPEKNFTPSTGVGHFDATYSQGIVKIQNRFKFSWISTLPLPLHPRTTRPAGGNEVAERGGEKCLEAVVLPADRRLLERAPLRATTAPAPTGKA